MKSLLHAAKLLARYGRDRLRYPRGSRLVMGNALVGRLLYSLIRRDVDILTETSLEKIVRDGKRPRDRAVLVSGGVSRDIGIDGGLILAGGGFNRHAGRRPAALGTDAEWSCRRAGFDRRRAGQGPRGRRPHQRQRSQRRILGAGVDPAPARRLAGGRFRTSCSTAASRGRWRRRRGRRFVNEAISYHQFALEMLAHGNAAIPAFLIADAAAVRKYGLGMVRPGGWGTRAAIADGYLIAAKYIEQLAQGLKIDPGSLRETSTG